MQINLNYLYATSGYIIPIISIQTLTVSASAKAIELKTDCNWDDITASPGTQE